MEGNRHWQEQIPLNYHYTNGTVFQVDIGSEETEREKKHNERKVCDEDMTNKEVYGTIKLRKKVLPPSIIYEDKKDEDLSKWCLNRDLSWVLINSVGQQLSNAEKLQPLVSWLEFMKQVTWHKTRKAVLKYLSVMSLPHGDNICKWYLDKMTEMVDELESNCIFLHADEAVHCKMMMIKWLNKVQYDKIIPLFGGFHTLMKLKILHKFVVPRLKRVVDWLRSTSTRIWYSRLREALFQKCASVRSFEALTRYRILKEVNIVGFSATMKTRIVNLREDPNSTNLNKLMNEEEFLSFTEQIPKTSNAMSQMTISYVKEMGNLLALISSVRELTT